MSQPPSTSSLLTTLLLTAAALIALAANSVLCRLALNIDGDAPGIDAASFTLIRLTAGAMMLMLLLTLRDRRRRLNTQQNPPHAARSTRASSSAPTSALPKPGSWLAAVYLFSYAIAFTYAYISLDTGIGALILFGAVQLTMIIVTLVGGTRLSGSEWLGLGLAFSGFIYLVLPDLSTPSLLGFGLMTLAGMAWGGYTLKGRGSSDPLADTAFNFLRTLPLAAVLLLVGLYQGHMTSNGVILAIASGALTSGIGYSIWYRVLADLSTTQAAAIQLLVPVIATAGGVVFVAEPVSWRLVIATLMILGGIALTILGRYTQTHRAAPAQS
ncbi:MAG: drug/metabolite transporter (DMT)-like permease [Motiliproteus sp.]|jgi:drug/metabolite transporter (DMT)-like permease